MLPCSQQGASPSRTRQSYARFHLFLHLFPFVGDSSTSHTQFESEKFNANDSAFETDSVCNGFRIMVSSVREYRVHSR
jgi:hypothetical protein